jgi:hypothetical protein
MEKPASGGLFDVMQGFRSVAIQYGDNPHYVAGVRP